MPSVPRRALARLAVASLAAALLAPTAAAHAQAGAPTMPLGQVYKGMRCTALSVVQGIDVSAFDAQVVDVVAGDAASEAPRILLRFSGDAVDRTGVGPGFSGSPILCPDAQGTKRVIGAISEAIGEYGGLLALATPIDSILGTPVDPPGASFAPAPKNAKRLATPISLAGVSPKVGALFSRAAKRAGKLLYPAPGTPLTASFPVRPFQLGSSMAVGYSSGDVTAGAVGTVAYVDGERVWAFGHPLEGTGKRSLFLQDSYVYSVVDNPVGVEGATTYKLAAPGHDLGTLTSDGLSAVAGRTGVFPQRFPMKVVAKDQDSGRQRTLKVQIADEGALGLPSGVSPLALVGTAAVAQAAQTILGATPARQTGEMCTRITLAQRKAPLRFCNRYLTRSSEGQDGSFGVGSPMVGDFLEAVTAIDEFNFANLKVTGVEVSMKVRRGLRQAFLLDADGPATVRRGRDARVRVKLQEVRGTAQWRTVKVHVPKGMPKGERLLALEGTPSDAAAGLEVDLGELLFGSGGEGEGSAPDEAGPRTVAALAESVESITRFDGVTANFLPADEQELAALEQSGPTSDGPEGVAQKPREVLRDPELRLSGSVRIPVTVR